LLFPFATKRSLISLHALLCLHAEKAHKNNRFLSFLFPTLLILLRPLTLLPDSRMVGVIEPENRILMINDYSTTNISEDCFGYLNGYEFKKKEKIKIKYLNSQGIEKSINLNKKTFE